MTAVRESYLDQLDVNGEPYDFVALCKLPGLDHVECLPYSVRLLLENVARCSPGHLPLVVQRAMHGGPSCEVPFHPNRLMLHDTTCLPALVDLAGVRDVVARLGGDPAAVNPTIPCVLTVDHSVVVECHGYPRAADDNLAIDFRRNAERYRLIKWAEQSLDAFRVVPPGTGIIHQVNMEAIGQVVVQATDASGRPMLHPDNMVATDSHTPMINALGILGWGVGGLEGQAAMMGEPVSIPFPEVVGIRVVNALGSGITATDLALHLTELLRAHGVVGKFVEFCGSGLETLGWGDRATVANMAPEYGATVVFFPFDRTTLDYLHLTGRTAAQCERVAAYMTAQGLWRHSDSAEPRFNSVIDLDLSAVRRCVAGPSQPHQRRDLSAVAQSFKDEMLSDIGGNLAARTFTCAEFGEPVRHGAVVIAAITSCTNTANPRVMIQAGLLARRARRYGLRPKPWVKTSMSLGSRVVADYLRNSGLYADLAALGFDLTGFGCMTCIGNSGPLEPHAEAFCKDGLRGVALLSGNRNFEGRVNSSVGAAYLASPALVVAYALAGTVDLDVEQGVLGITDSGRQVRLDDLMPGDEEIEAAVREHVTPAIFRNRAETLWEGTPHWQGFSAERSIRWPWDVRSTYIQPPAYLATIARMPPASLAIRGARILLVLGDNVTTDHISPAGTIPPDSPAGRYLLARGEPVADLNQYSTRRSNHEVMLRGAFTNRGAVNRMPGTERQGRGALAYTADRTAVVPVYDAAATYSAAAIPLVVIAGRNYGVGSSRDWAAKVQALLGVKAVIARSYERIHRSNLIGMGVFPLEFGSGDDREQYGFTGQEVLDFEGLDSIDVGLNRVLLRGAGAPIPLTLRVDSRQELRYLRNGGVLPYVVRRVVAAQDVQATGADARDSRSGGR
ncbi:MAG TPA: aconitate hydratase AcnA [Vicinamibacterales bacterium]|jgi:aconitate hydratase